MNIIYGHWYQQAYVSDVKGGPNGARRADWRFWMATGESAVVRKDDCIFGIMDDFGNMVETDGRAYNKNAHIGMCFPN